MKVSLCHIMLLLLGSTGLCEETLEKALGTIADSNAPLENRLEALTKISGGTEKVSKAWSTLEKLFYSKNESSEFRGGVLQRIASLDLSEEHKDKTIAMISGSLSDPTIRKHGMVAIARAKWTLQNKEIQGSLLAIVRNREIIFSDRQYAVALLAKVAADNTTAMAVYDFLEESDNAEQIALDALKKMTAKDFGRDFKAWRKYLNKKDPTPPIFEIKGSVPPKNLFEVAIKSMQASNTIAFSVAGGQSSIGHVAFTLEGKNDVAITPISYFGCTVTEAISNGENCATDPMRDAGKENLIRPWYRKTTAGTEQFTMDFSFNLMGGKMGSLEKLKAGCSIRYAKTSKQIELKGIAAMIGKISEVPELKELGFQIEQVEPKVIFKMFAEPSKQAQIKSIRFTDTNGGEVQVERFADVDWKDRNVYWTPQFKTSPPAGLNMMVEVYSDIATERIEYSYDAIKANSTVKPPTPPDF